MVKYKAITFTSGSNGFYYYDTTFEDALMKVKQGTKCVLEDGKFQWKAVTEGIDPIDMKNVKWNIGYFYY